MYIRYCKESNKYLSLALTTTTTPTPGKAFISPIKNNYFRKVTNNILFDLYKAKAVFTLIIYEPIVCP